MKFFTTLMAIALAATSVVANTVTFVTLDDATRTIIFTPSAGHPEIASVTVSKDKQTTVTFPEGYIGNYYAIKQGAAQTPGMLGEVTFGGYAGKTYFDVSAIVNPGDKDNVKQMWPAKAKTPISGCTVFPCNDAYYHSDDPQTRVTDEVDLIQTLGSN